MGRLAGDGVRGIIGWPARPDPIRRAVPAVRSIALPARPASRIDQGMRTLLRAPALAATQPVKLAPEPAAALKPPSAPGKESERPKGVVEPPAPEPAPAKPEPMPKAEKAEPPKGAEP